MKKFLPILAAILFMAGTIHAQTTDFTVNPTYCGTFSSPQRCPGLSITVLDANFQPTGPSGTINLSYNPVGYAVGYPYLDANGATAYRTVKDYGYIQFNADFQGLAGRLNPPYPYQYAAAITDVLPDGSLAFKGVADDGTTVYYGVISYTYSTHRITACSGRACAHSTWTITGGSLSVTRVDY